MSSSKTKNVAFASATPTNTGEELLGKLLAFRPIETRVIETRIGESEATIAEIVQIEPDGTPIGLGERPIFWQVVRAQLAKANEQVPWIVGRLVQSGQAYRLDGITDADAALVRRALLASK